MLKQKCLILLGFILISIGLSACSPEVGSEKWCENMEAKPKGDWTANESADYLKNCLIKTDDN